MNIANFTAYQIKTNTDIKKYANLNWIKQIHHNINLGIVSNAVYNDQF